MTESIVRFFKLHSESPWGKNARSNWLRRMISISSGFMLRFLHLVTEDAFERGIKLFLYHLERIARCYFEKPYEFPKNSILLASFPKSGNSWFRFVVSNVNAITLGHDAVTFQNVSKYSPVIRGNRRLSNRIDPGVYPIFLKTHFPHNVFFRKRRAVVIVRNPFFVMPSYYDYLLNARGKYVSEFDKFIWHWRYGLNAWAQFMKSWTGVGAIILRYEDLISNPELIFQKLYNELGFHVEPTVMSLAISRSSRKNMKNILESHGDPNNKNSFKFVKDESENEGMLDKKPLILKSSRCSRELLEMLEEYKYI